MADSYHIIDGQVVPFHGGRKDTNTGAWRDATPLELQLQEQLAAAEEALAEAAAALEAVQFESHQQSENTATKALEYVFGKMPLESWRRIIDEEMTPPWPLPHHADAMGLLKPAAVDEAMVERSRKARLRYFSTLPAPALENPTVEQSRESMRAALTAALAGQQGSRSGE